jgi:hypothetical protein
MDAAAIVIALASLAFFVHGWHVRAQAELDQHIADALNNAHDDRADRNRAAFDRLGKEHNR